MQENRMHLTPRLRTIMQQVPEGARLADIGTDHALIPTALLRRGVIQSAIASDLREGPLDSAARTAKQFEVEHKLSLRLGGGLQNGKTRRSRYHRYRRQWAARPLRRFWRMTRGRWTGRICCCCRL